MPQVRIMQSAWEDISSIADYYLRVAGSQSAQRIVGRLLDTIELLSDNPYLGPIHHDPFLQSRGFRKLVCGQYVCVYRVDDNTATVYHVFYGGSDYARSL